MSDIFISYKREDEARVGRLAKALHDVGLSIWWDRRLAGGENWRSQIENELDAAKCVIVVWTHQSAGPAGDFVRDEAEQAKLRGVLLPVKLDKVNPPLGFRQIQTIDLTHWKGSPRDPFFQDLAAAVAAKLEGRDPPPAKGPTQRLMRRLTYSGLGSAMVFGCVSFGYNLFRVQDRVCGTPLLQPAISDVCGALRLGDRPTKAERIAWAARKPGSCADLRTHIERFPNGAYAAEAATMLAARRGTQMEVWIPTTRRLNLFEPQADVAFPNKTAAQADARARAQADAERECGEFAATTLFRLRSATPAPQVWNCSLTGKGQACGFEGAAVCELEERRIQEQETCGKPLRGGTKR
jgi:hypothetical protein